MLFVKAGVMDAISIKTSELKFWFLQGLKHISLEHMLFFFLFHWCMKLNLDIHDLTLKVKHDQTSPNE